MMQGQDSDSEMGIWMNEHNVNGGKMKTFGRLAKYASVYGIFMQIKRIEIDTLTQYFIWFFRIHSNQMPEFQINEFYLASIDKHAFVIEYLQRYSKFKWEFYISRMVTKEHAEC